MEDGEKGMMEDGKNGKREKWNVGKLERWKIGNLFHSDSDCIFGREISISGIMEERMSFPNALIGNLSKN